MSKPLFHQLLDDGFNQLPQPIRYLHNGQSKVLNGRCNVLRGTGVLSRLFAWATSLPPAGDDQPIEVSIECNHHGEVWTRRFGNRRMTSYLSAQGTTLVEYLGPTRFKFMLAYDATTQVINWRLINVRAMGIPLPVSWFDAVTASESVNNGRYGFDVAAALPIVGLLVKYKGWLDVG
jgi:hypothetical protein